MGRKMTMRDGGCLAAFKKEILDFCEAHREHPELGDRVRALNGVLQRLLEMAEEMKQRMKNDPLQWASYTYPALMAFGDVIMCWRLLEMAIIAADVLKKKKSDFYQGKVFQATYFTDITLPQTLANMETCLRPGREILDIPDSAF
jgi:hypothetical protein